MARDPQWEPLLRLDYDGLTAAVCRDRDGSFWLTSHLGGRGGPLLDWYKPARMETEMDSGIVGTARALLGRAPIRSVLGGRAPDRVVRVEVQDSRGERKEAVTGDGAWLAVLDEEIGFQDPVVTFLDDSGAPVRPPHPPGAVVRPVADADSPCPSCGHRGWELVTSPSPFAHLEGEGASTEESLACMRCGHAESKGGIMVFTASEGDVEAQGPPVPTWSRRELDRLRRAPFAPYGLAGWTGLRALGGFGTGRRRRLTSVSLVHGSEQHGPWLEVETSSDDECDSYRELALRGLATALSLEAALDTIDVDIGHSDEALILDMRHVSRGQDRRAAAAPERETTIDVDGRAVAFLLRGADEAWGAAARHDGLTLTLSARGTAPGDVALEHVRDLEPYLAA